MCSPLRFGHEQSDQLIGQSKSPWGDAQNNDVNGFEFFTEITVRRKAADVMGSATDARQS